MSLLLEETFSYQYLDFREMFSTFPARYSIYCLPFAVCTSLELFSMSAGSL